MCLGGFEQNSAAFIGPLCSDWVCPYDHYYTIWGCTPISLALCDKIEGLGDGSFKDCEDYHNIVVSENEMEKQTTDNAMKARVL